MRPLPTVDTAQLEELIGVAFRDWSHQCHSISLAIVKTRLYDGARVARGYTPGVAGQHSWVTIGDPYDTGVAVIDPTLWSYVRDIDGVWIGHATDRPHTPHGAGIIFEADRPHSFGGKPIELQPREPLSRRARVFLEALEPLDARGWIMLADSPVGGWPAAEIIAAMDDTPELSAFVPIDRLGMLTDRNPHGLYLPTSLPSIRETVDANPDAETW